MTTDNGQHNYFVAVDIAATALGVTKAQARVLAHRYKWRRQPGRPVGYLMADVRETARKRRDAKDDPTRGARPATPDTPRRGGNTDGA